jgi:cytochrome c553
MKNSLAAGGLTCLLALSIIFLAACKSSTSPQIPGVVKDNPSFAADVQLIFNNSCVNISCHGASTQGGMTLVQGQSYSNIVNVSSTEDLTRKRVLPFDADDSFLVIKVEGRQSVGARMPASKDRLSDTQIQNIKNWINKGAKDN